MSLILKTFPNPHNTVAELLAPLVPATRTHPTSVGSIVTWTPSPSRALQPCRLLCPPCRGEGFGLPVAEAMAAGVPVISVAYSGLADFVSDETASTIPFRLEPAETHFEIPHSVWAEPDRTALDAQMRSPRRGHRSERFRASPTRPGTGQLQVHLGGCARRWNDFLNYVEDAAEKPRVAMVTTWNTRCGVAENTRNIVDRVGAQMAIDILANIDAEDHRPGSRTRSPQKVGRSLAP